VLTEEESVKIDKIAC